MNDVRKKSYYLKRELAFEMVRMASLLEISQSELAENAIAYYLDFLRATIPSKYPELKKYIG